MKIARLTSTRSGKVALGGVLAAKLGLVGLILLLLPGLAIGLGAAHGVVLLALGITVGGVIATRWWIGRSRTGIRETRPGGGAVRAVTRIRTADPPKYLTHLCRHAGKMRHRLSDLHGRSGPDLPKVLDVQSTDSTGTLVLSLGTCTLHAADDVLTVWVEAEDEESLTRLQQLITADLERFGRREGLTVSWERTDAEVSTEG